MKLVFLVALLLALEGCRGAELGDPNWVNRDCTDACALEGS
jgi:hypothetical protein